MAISSWSCTANGITSKEKHQENEFGFSAGFVTGLGPIPARNSHRSVSCEQCYDVVFKKKNILIRGRITVSCILNIDCQSDTDFQLLAVLKGTEWNLLKLRTKGPIQTERVPLAMTTS